MCHIQRCIRGVVCGVFAFIDVWCGLGHSSEWCSGKGCSSVECVCIGYIQFVCLWLSVVCVWVIRLVVSGCVVCSVCVCGSVFVVLVCICIWLCGCCSVQGLSARSRLGGSLVVVVSLLALCEAAVLALTLLL